MSPQETESDVCRELQIASAIDAVTAALANQGYLVYVLNQRGEFEPVVGDKEISPDN
jgi:hypothetical protein